ncbi:protein FAM200B-like [Stegodyphus dumicola]|uniref:protein FAM200B-like n=1 Tax=Stegodyphus dumicola TaxID=202533 RepID=UPI0015AF22FF|nr:protein FAM200B-like [Stegodyphus dumicola]
MSVIQDLQLSESTVLRRVEAIPDGMQSQHVDGFSLQFNESTDISDTSWLAVMIRMVFNDFSVKEELLKILPLRTRGEDIYNVFKMFAAEIGLPLKNLLVIIIDKATAMTGRTNGFVTLCKKDECFPNFMSYHCIIHQEGLCTKILPF